MWFETVVIVIISCHLYLSSLHLQKLPGQQSQIGRQAGGQAGIIIFKRKARTTTQHSKEQWGIALYHTGFTRTLEVSHYLQYTYLPIR